MRIISPSILSADFGNIERDVRMLNSSVAEWIHFDVMDGVFVPNISFGFPLLRCVRSYTDKVLDVHLMIVNPERYIERFAKEGADIITFHYEATDNPRAVIEQIRKCGVRVGISIKPATEVAAIEELIPLVDMVLVMGVEPGFGGQKIFENTANKVRQVRDIALSQSVNTLIQIDGGATLENASSLFEAGTDVIVAGSAVFCAKEPLTAIEMLLNA